MVHEVMKHSCGKMNVGVVNELHRMFQKMEENAIAESGWRVAESAPECETMEKSGHSFTISEIVDYSVDNLSLEAGMAIQNVLYGLMAEGSTLAERRMVASISNRIIQRGNDSAKYYEGAHIGKVVNYYAPYYENHYAAQQQDSTDYSDEQVARAIMAINGENKPLNSKRKWAAVYWGLRWYCNYPTGVREFCERVRKLPLGEVEYGCDYNNIRQFCTLSFMNQDARFLDKVKPSREDNSFYLQCREVVQALASEMKKQRFVKDMI